jgi:hypothetical protein
MDAIQRGESYSILGSEPKISGALQWTSIFNWSSRYAMKPLLLAVSCEKVHFGVQIVTLRPRFFSGNSETCYFHVFLNNLC